MKPRCDLLVHSASAVHTVAGRGGGPLSGSRQGETSPVRDGAVACARGRVLEVGPSRALRRKYAARREVDAAGNAVVPGLVDAHTHLAFAGDRAREFERRCLGATYQEIAAAGGGIRSSVRAFRSASRAEVLANARALRRSALLHGTTTMEVKSGYGLSLEEEIKALEVARALDDRGDVVPTFLGAHAVPPEYDGRSAAYARVVADEMIPEVARRGLARYCDVFCEKGYFDARLSRRILLAAREHGLGLRIHADELSACGGAQLAAETGCASADHLLRVGKAGIRALAGAGVVAVLLPGTSFFLGMGRWAPARRMIEAGVPVALGTDCNPGSSMTESLQACLTLACLGLRMTAAEALVAATRNAACSLGLGNQCGRLAPGYRADLVVLDVPDPRLLAYHHGVNHAAVVVHHGAVVR
ncbi:MAG TPA: imidazolonepropionase [Planctomycetota bacterium]|nr:imidazolonepropionase [Planctomycetota bacterium]